MKITRAEVFKNIAWLGGTVTLAGGLRYAIQETLTEPSKWMLVGGGAVLLVGLVGCYREVLAFLGRRGTRLGANTALLTVSILAILAVANVLAARHPKRFDLTEEKLYSLSDQTKKIAAGLKTDVTVMKFDKQDDAELRQRVAEYRAVSRHIRYEFVDPQEKPELARQYAVQRFGDIVVTNGARTERPTDGSEQELTNALLKLTRDASKTICFVEGHGERALEAGDETSLSTADSGLKRENYQSKSVNLVSANGVPAECTVVVVAGPKKAFFPQEVEFLRKYLDAGGKALLLIDPDTDPKFDDLLKAWRVDVGRNTVVDVSGFGRLIGTGPAVPLVMNYGSHPITKGFGRDMTIFPLARSVKQLDSKSEPADGVTVTSLLMTSPESWAETNLAGGKAKFDEGQDTRGPVSLGVAASKKAGDKEARLVVIGDSDFATNRYIGAQLNGDLFFNTVNWLAQDDDLISVRPRNPANRQVTLTQSQQNMLFWGSTILLPGAVVLAGIVIWWRRR